MCRHKGLNTATLQSLAMTSSACLQIFPLYNTACTYVMEANRLQQGVSTPARVIGMDCVDCVHMGKP